MSLFTARFSLSFQAAARCLWQVLAVCVLWFVTSTQTTVMAETCGHYLFRNGLPVDGSKGLALSGHAPLDSENALTDSQNPWQPEPCNGLGCRQHSIPLSAPAGGLVTTVASEFATLLQDLYQNDLTVPGHLLPVSESGHFYLSQPVFRPPICS